MTSGHDDPEATERDEDEREAEERGPDMPVIDPGVPAADAAEQAEAVAPVEHLSDITRDIEVPEADAVEQAIEVPDDPDEEHHTS